MCIKLNVYLEKSTEWSSSLFFLIRSYQLSTALVCFVTFSIHPGLSKMTRAARSLLAALLLAPSAAQAQEPAAWGETLGFSTFSIAAVDSASRPAVDRPPAAGTARNPLHSGEGAESKDGQLGLDRDGSCSMDRSVNAYSTWNRPVATSAGHAARRGACRAGGS